MIKSVSLMLVSIAIAYISVRDIENNIEESVRPIQERNEELRNLRDSYRRRQKNRLFITIVLVITVLVLIVVLLI